MSVDRQPSGGPPFGQLQLLVLVVTVVAFGAVIVLAAIGQAIAAAVIGTLWGATCTLLAKWRPSA
ncbi:hypothetical protein EV649_7835 [Kribbella sp. VKM Ac-2569]|uniref:hypothetical protein n=1 Tax=Kribbella sp. VKM Ac-2569 TaxID=2512220 RepID=UPI00102C1FE4|nr:hypothetical protein [Kribbella sp. VKM Ac-2569]RZT07905.1 hypothetical protein EV649_7835 [Kribbella sp. VKM Ac-2569]